VRSAGRSDGGIDRGRLNKALNANAATGFGETPGLFESACSGFIAALAKWARRLRPSRSSDNALQGNSCWACCCVHS